MEDLRAVRPWLLLRCISEGDQGEFLCSWIDSIRRVLETLSHRTLHPPMATFLANAYAKSCDVHHY
jgi:hypothetical protein